MERIYLTEQQIKDCYYLAEIRKLDSHNKGLHHTRDYKEDPDPEKEKTKQALSFAAEMVVTQYLGIPQQTGIANEGKPDGFLTISGALSSFDVKYSASSPYFSIPPKHTKISNLFILVNGDFIKGFVIAGVISAERIKRKGHLETYGYSSKGQCYSLHTEYSMQIDDFRKVLHK